MLVSLPDCIVSNFTKAVNCICNMYRTGCLAEQVHVVTNIHYLARLEKKLTSIFQLAKALINFDSIIAWLDFTIISQCSLGNFYSSLPWVPEGLDRKSVV